MTENANARLVGLGSSLSAVALIVLLAWHLTRMLPDAAIAADDPDPIEAADHSHEPPTIV